MNRIGNDLYDKIIKSKEVFLEKYDEEIVNGRPEFYFTFEGGWLVILDQIDVTAYYDEEDIDSIYREMLIFLEDLKKENGYYDY